MYDTAIIGKGPAGITAAIYLKRANLNPVIIGKDFGALEKAGKIENYYGVMPISGLELAKIGQKQAENLNIPIFSEEVVSVEAGEEFLIKTDLQTVEARSLLIASGKSRKEPQIRNLSLFNGKGVSFCAVCDGFFFRNKKIGVLGSGAYAISEAEHLSRFTKNIILFTNGNPVPDNLPDYLHAEKEKILELTGGETLSGLKTQNKEYDLDGLFIAEGAASTADFAKKIGIVTDASGNIKTDDDYMTGVNGVFSAGDATGGFLQIATAVNKGCLAAKGIIEFLKKKSK